VIAVTPRGFRDVMPEEALRRERISEAVRELFAEHGYLPIETPLLEDRRSFEHVAALPDTTFEINDADGRTLMLRSDLTLPISRLVSTHMRSGQLPLRLRYSAPVVRDEGMYTGRPRQFTQLGIELIGQEGRSGDAEVVTLAAQAVQAAGIGKAQIVCGNVKIAQAALQATGADDGLQRDVLRFIHESDLVGLDDCLAESGLSEAAVAALSRIPRISGKADALDEARRVLQSIGASCEGIDELEAVVQDVREAGFGDWMSIDLSVMNSFDYYTGLVFEIYAGDAASPLGSGGRYDGMLGRWGLDVPAAGFAFSLDLLEQVLDNEPAERPLRIAVPKGSLFEGSVDALERAGFNVDNLRDPGRHLIVKEEGVEYIIVRPTDAPVFVASGGADCGICGRDSLIEADLPLVQLVDLGFGACRFIVAEPADAKGKADQAYERRGTIRVSTKYPRITQQYYERKGQQVDIITLHGNIELGPVVGLSDRIVDITATGRTLRENNLVIVDEVLTCTARFFANPARARTDPRIAQLAGILDHKRHPA
jgi:ATP phosphoribosyltransferase